MNKGSLYCPALHRLISPVRSRVIGRGAKDCGEVVVQHDKLFLFVIFVCTHTRAQFWVLRHDLQSRQLDNATQNVPVDVLHVLRDLLRGLGLGLLCRWLGPRVGGQVSVLTLFSVDMVGVRVCVVGVRVNEFC
eukprot:COSAG06_NODE_15813_length_1042_cov_16.311771_2_plen_133_part_00